MPPSRCRRYMDMYIVLSRLLETDMDTDTTVRLGLGAHAYRGTFIDRWVVCIVVVVVVVNGISSAGAESGAGEP